MADGGYGARRPRAKYHLRWWTGTLRGLDEDRQTRLRRAFQKRGLAGRVLTLISSCWTAISAAIPVDRLEHSVQTATRAHRAGMDEEYVVCALLHDIGDTIGSASHADIGAAILKPYVSEQNHWMVENHAIFQGYYFFDFLGLDKNMREQYRGHPNFEYTAQFCHLYDQNAFDPAYEAMPLEAFEPMVERVFSTVKRSIYKKPGGAMAVE